MDMDVNCTVTIITYFVIGNQIIFKIHIISKVYKLLYTVVKRYYIPFLNGSISSN